ncbi:MAG: glycosyltransferase [Solirubrobacterales bacterium]
MLVPIGEPIGGQMSAVGIRQIEVGRALAAHCTVTFASTAATNDEGHGIPIVPCRTRAEFRDLLRTHDVLYTLGLNSDRFLDVVRSGIRVVLDLYTPLAFEVMECWPEVPDAVMEPLHRRSVRWTLAQLARADFIVCASEPQKDLWLGMMNATGMLTVGDSRRDPAWHERIAVVPFGVPEGRPQPQGHPLRDRLPGLARGDFLMLWSSKLLTWQDPETLIHAMALLREQDPTIRLVFLGIGEPRPLDGSMYDNATLPTRRTRAIADELRLTNETVFFLTERVPYREMGAYYRDADVAIATYPDSLETRICLGTRLLDYLWAGLPMVVSGVELQREFVEGQGLGRVARPHDAAGLAGAIAQLRRDVATGGVDESAFARAAERLRWSRVTAPIVRYCESSQACIRRSRARRWSALLPMVEFMVRSIACRLHARLHGVR